MSVWVDVKSPPGRHMKRIPQFSVGVCDVTSLGSSLDPVLVRLGSAWGETALAC